MGSSVEDIKHRANLLELVRERVEMHRQGARHMGLCPFHEEKTPSFFVNEREGFWHCFGCGKGGDVIGWVRATLNVDFHTALQVLAEKYHLPLPEWSEEERQRHERRVRMDDLLGQVADLLAAQFAGSPAAEYVASRGLDPARCATYKAGYARCEADLQPALKTWSAEELRESGLFSGGRDDDGRLLLWTERLVVPIVDRGRVVNLYSRALLSVDNKHKHRYLAEHPRPGWNLDGRRHGQLTLVCEGILDAWALAEAGYPASMATLGGMAKDQPARFAERLAGEERVVVVPDCDPVHEGAADGALRPGQELGLRMARELGRLGIAVDLADLSEGHEVEGKLDAALVFQLAGAEPLRRMVASALTPVQFRQVWGLPATDSLVEMQGSGQRLRFGPRTYLCTNLDATDPQGRRVSLECRDAKGALLAKDALLLASSFRRRQFSKQVTTRTTDLDKTAVEAERLQIDTELLALDEELRLFLAEAMGPKTPTEETEVVISPEEREEALELLKSPRLQAQVVEDVHRLGVVGERNLVLLLYLVMTSRLMAEPLLCCVKGSSSAGKSFVAGMVSDLCPPEDLRDFSRVTPQALFYVREDWLKHKLLLMRERVGGESADYSIRTMMSEKGLTLLTPQKDKADHLQSEPRVVEGPMAYIETTTQEVLNEENETRLLEVWPDESPAQTQSILERQRQMALVEGLRDEPERLAVIRRHCNAQRLLDQELRVVIPWAETLDFPATMTRHRRDHAKLLTLVEAVAFLRQKQKEAHELTLSSGDVLHYVEADLLDYGIAYDLARVLLAQTLDEVDNRSRELLKVLWNSMHQRVLDDPNRMATYDPTPEEVCGQSFSRKDAREALKQAGQRQMSSRAVNRLLEQLHDVDCIAQDGGGVKGHAVSYKLSVNNPERPEMTALLTVEELAERVVNHAERQG